MGEPSREVTDPWPYTPCRCGCRAAGAPQPCGCRECSPGPGLGQGRHVFVRSERRRLARLLALDNPSPLEEQERDVLLLQLTEAERSAR